MNPPTAGALILRPRVLLAWVLPAILLLALLGALVRGQGGSIALVQHTGKDAGTVTSSTLAFTANNTAGNWIAVAIRAWKCGPTLSVTDTRGNTYRMAMRFNETVDGMTLAVFYAESIAGGPNTVTVSGIQAGGTLRLAILEYSGVATANSLDVTASAQGTSTAPTTSTVTSTASGDLVLGLLSTANARTFTPGSGYVIQDRVPAAPNTKFVVEDRIQTTAGPVSANGTLNTSDIWGAALAAFRPAGGSGGDTTLPSVALSAPANNSIVAGTAVTVSANASDNVGVGGVQFLVDGAPFGAEDTTSPYSIAWDTTTATSASHALSARARDLAGNTATAAALSVIVDNQAPTGSVVINGGAAATNSTSATLTLSAVDNAQPVTQMRLSNTGTSFSAAEAYATTKAWTLTTGAGTKTVYVQFKDTIGNWSGSSTDTITLDTAAPAVSGVGSSNLSNTSATISWTTNEPATSQVEYGTTTSYGTLTSLDATLVTSHSVVIAGLASQTPYNYRVRSRDSAGNEGVGSNGTFTTLSGPDTTAPSTPTGLAAVVMSPSQINLSWNAATDNVGVTGYLVYRDTNQVATPSTTSFQNTGLTAGTTYSYTVAARDAAGNISAQSVPVTTATPWFVVSNVQSSAMTATSATISWTTDQPADGQVEYGATTAYGQLTPLASPLTTAHSATLTGLSQSTTYHYRVRSRDAASHLVMSNDFVFTTNSAATSGVFQNEVLISGMNLPTAVKFLPNGDMLILELGGKIWRVPAGTTQVSAAPFLTLTNIGSVNGQQGLMDLVLDPGFSANRNYYVFYTLGLAEPRPRVEVHGDGRLPGDRGRQRSRALSGSSGS